MDILTAKRALEIKYFSTMSEVEAYMYQKKTPIHLKKRLRQFYEYKYHKKYFREATISNLFTGNSYLRKSLVQLVLVAF